MLEAISIEKKVKLIIRYDHSCDGYYLYVYDLENNKCIIDHLCDDLSPKKIATFPRMSLKRLMRYH